MKKLGLVLLLSSICIAQNSSYIKLQTPPPNQPSAFVNASSGGGNTYYYWLVSTFTIGTVLPNSPIVVYNAPAVSVSKPITITWNSNGATNYTILRTTTNAFPIRGASSAVVAGTGCCSYSDVGSGLSTFTYGTPPNTAIANLVLDNQNYSVPTIVSDTPMVIPNPGSYVLPAATAAVLGGVIVPTCAINQHFSSVAAGVLQCTNDSGGYVLPNSTNAVLGGVITPTCGAGNHFSSISGGTLVCSPDSGGGSSNVVITTGTDNPPAANCVAPSITNLAQYWNTSDYTLWVCDNTNHWSLIFKGASGDPVQVSGATQAALATPSSGVSCYFDSTALTWQCKNAAGTVFTSVKVAATRTANQFVTHIPATGIPTTAAIANADLPTTTLNGVLTYTAGVPAAIGTSATNCVHEDGSSGACGSGGGGYDPTDLTRKVVRETFCGAAVDPTNTGFGQLGWHLLNNSGGGAAGTSTIPCGIVGTTAGGANDAGVFHVPGNPNPSGGAIIVRVGTTSDWLVTFKASFSTLTAASYYLGLGASVTATGAWCKAGTNSNCLAWGFDSTVNASQFRIVSCNGYDCSSSTSTITPVTGTMFTFTIKSVGTTISAYVNSETPISVSTHVPVLYDMSPAIRFAAEASAVAKAITFSDFLFTKTGL